MSPGQDITPEAKTPIADAVTTAAKAVADPALTPEQGNPKKRTVGNKVFDMLVYPTIAFGAVFGFSLWATYQGKYGQGWINNQYDKLAQKLAKSRLLKNQPPKQALEKGKSYAMVLVSFLAGTLLISPIKLFEDSREKISAFIDRCLGTTPEDRSQYASEPKQSWLSVLGGRVLTFASVFTLALGIGGHIDDASRKMANKITSEKIPDLIAAKAATRKWKIMFVAAFEAIYTALCASEVYLLSRGLARFLNKKENVSGEPASVGNNETQRKEAPFKQAESQSQEKEVTWTTKTAPKTQSPRPENYVAGVDASRKGLSQTVSA